MIGSGPHQPRFAIISWRASTQPPVFIGSPCGHTVPGRDSSDSELFVWPTWLMILKNMGSENSLWNLISIAYFFHYFWFWGNAWTRWRSLCLFALLNWESAWSKGCSSGRAAGEDSTQEVRLRGAAVSSQCIAESLPPALLGEISFWS